MPTRVDVSRPRGKERHRRGRNFGPAGTHPARIDLRSASSLAARFAGPELAQHCARYLVLDERRSQVPYMAISALVEADETLAAAERWVHHNLAINFDIGTLASAVALTPRTFARRLAATCGVSPSRFVQRIRVEAATQLLATTSLSVEEISARVGYADASTLRRTLKRETGRAPSTLRG